MTNAIAFLVPIVLVLIYNLICKLRRKWFRRQMMRTDLDKVTWKKYFRKCLYNYQGMVASNCLINERWEEFKGKVSPADAVWREFE